MVVMLLVVEAVLIESSIRRTGRMLQCNGHHV